MMMPGTEIPEFEGVRAMDGELADLPLGELLQFLHVTGHDGVLIVSDPSGRPRAVVHYVGSQIVHATCDGIHGAEAVYAALTHQQGRFEFLLGRPRTELEGLPIRESVQNLILEGLRRLDELSHMARLLPADDKLLFLAPSPPADDIRLTAREWRFLSLVDGKRTIRQIVDTSERPEHEARAALVGLLTADLVVDRRDDAYLDRIVPRPLRQDEAGVARYAPPTLLANLVFKACDGRKPLRRIIAEMATDERLVLEEIRLLARTRWIGFASGREEYDRWIA